MMKLLVLFGLIAASYCWPVQEQYETDEYVPYNFEPEEYQVLYRPRRFVAKVDNTKDIKNFQRPNPYPVPDRTITPHIYRQDGTTNVGAEASHRGKNWGADGHWNKNVAGQGKNKPNWGINVGGTW